MRIRLIAPDSVVHEADVSAQPVVIGQDPTCGISLRNDTISHLHARLSLDAGQVTVEDLASTNGTFVNGVQVNGTAPLLDGTELQLGAERLRVELIPPASPPAQTADGANQIRRAIILNQPQRLEPPALPAGLAPPRQAPMKAVVLGPPAGHSAPRPMRASIKRAASITVLLALAAFALWRVSRGDHNAPTQGSSSDEPLPSPWGDDGGARSAADQEDGIARLKKSQRNWIKTVNQGARNLCAPGVLTKMSDANSGLASAYSDVLKERWLAAPFDADLDFNNDLALEEAATAWAEKRLKAIEIPEVLRDLSNVAVPLSFVAYAPSVQERRERESYSFMPGGASHEPQPGAIQYPLEWRINPAQTEGTGLGTTEVTLEYRFAGYDPNAWEMTLVADIPRSQIVGIPDDIRNRFPSEEFYGPIFVTPPVHVIAPVSRDATSNPWDPLPSIADDRDAVVRYPSPTQATDQVIVNIGSAAAAKMKRERMTLRVTHKCTVELRWVLRPQVANMERYRKEVAKGERSSPVWPWVSGTLWLRIDTRHTVNGVTLPHLPNRDEWEDIITSGKATGSSSDTTET